MNIENLFKKSILPLLGLMIVCYTASIIASPLVSALTDDDIKSIYTESTFYDPNSQSCETVSAGAVGAGGTNKDYAGNTILNKGQLEKISENQSVYEQAAKEVDIPWQMIAITHLRETSLGRTNPDNGQGLYQFVSKQGGPYPAGPVDEAEFLRQSILAAKFLKGKASSNVKTNRELTTSSNADVIKDTFFSYNGRAGVYADQAASLGYSPETQPFEGSPYVMNKADAKRDPNANPTGWGQIKQDFGGIEYPANQGYGAFVAYGALAGIPIGAACNGTLQGSVRQKVVTLAQQELALWESKELTPGTGFLKYSQNRNEDWCADFVSWIYNQAGYPLSDTKEGNVPAVITIKQIGEKNQKFRYYNSASYTPKPGDIAVKTGHVMLVVGVSGNKITVIGGNQGGTGDPFYKTSKVSQYSYTNADGDSVIGYVSPD